MGCWSICRIPMDPAGIPALIDPIRHLHGYGATHVETVHVRQTARNGELAWDSDVEVIDLTGVEKVPIYGEPIAELVSTSYAERMNLSVRKIGPPLHALDQRIQQEAGDARRIDGAHARRLHLHAPAQDAALLARDGRWRLQDAVEHGRPRVGRARRGATMSAREEKRGPGRPAFAEGTAKTGVRDPVERRRTAGQRRRGAESGQTRNALGPRRAPRSGYFFFPRFGEVSR
jgi:hypothetical protein